MGVHDERLLKRMAELGLVEAQALKSYPIVWRLVSDLPLNRLEQQALIGEMQVVKERLDLLRESPDSRAYHLSRQNQQIVLLWSCFGKLLSLQGVESGPAYPYGPRPDLATTFPLVTPLAFGPRPQEKARTLLFREMLMSHARQDGIARIEHETARMAAYIREMEAFWAACIHHMQRGT